MDEPDIAMRLGISVDDVRTLLEQARHFPDLDRYCKKCTSRSVIEEGMERVCIKCGVIHPINPIYSNLAYGVGSVNMLHADRNVGTPTQSLRELNTICDRSDKDKDGRNVNWDFGVAGTYKFLKVRAMNGSWDRHTPDGKAKMLVFEATRKCKALLTTVLQGVFGTSTGEGFAITNELGRMIEKQVLAFKRLYPMIPIGIDAQHMFVLNVLGAAKLDTNPKFRHAYNIFRRRCMETGKLLPYP